MNFKTHKKGLIALALVFFMIVPMLSAISLVRATNDAVGSFSVVQDSNGANVFSSGAAPSPTTTSSVTVSASPNPIGTYVYFDIYISGAANVWGWTIGTVTWNAAVLNLKAVKEGPWLQDNVGTATSPDATYFVGSSAALFDNTPPTGSISGGLSESVSTSGIAATSAGVVAMLKFEVTGYGTSPITIAGAELVDTPNDASSPVAATSVSSASVTVQAPPLSISLVPHGQTSGNTITEPSSTSPIGDTFQVDAYVAGAVGNIWGWSLNIAWNPNVLEMTGITEGSYLSANPALASTATLFSSGYIDNTAGSSGDGTVQGGVNDAYSAQTTSTAGAGVLCTFQFEVIGYGSSTITITPGVSVGTPATPAALLTDNIPPQAISCVLNNLNYVWTAPAAVNPTAVITVTGSPYGPTSVNTFTGYGITLSGATSTPGTSQEPPGTPCPITGYSWSIMLVGATTPITFNTETVALTDAQIGQVPGTITATLTVTAPVPATYNGVPAYPSPGYSPTSQTTLTIQVETPTPGGVLDIWTQNGGQGPNVDASSFGPQQMVYLYAYVSYNGAPVVDKTVTWAIQVPDVGTIYVTAPTDQSGLANAEYRLPWQDSDPQQYFGEITISGSVDVAQVVLTDTLHFYYGYQLCLNSVTIKNGGTPPTFNRYGMGAINGSIVEATVSVTNTMWNSQAFWLAAVIYDNNNVPVAQFLMQETIGPGTPISGNTNTWQNTNTQTYQITLTIPTWAYVGAGELLVNIFNTTDPTGQTLQNPTAYSPQVEASLTITASYFNNVINPSATQPTQLVNIYFSVNNDEDSGVHGYWAMDQYWETLQVWSLGNNQYESVETYKGTFTTYNTALSPQAGTPEECGSPQTGTFTGEIISTFTATKFNPAPYYGPVQLTDLGTISGLFNFGGSVSDILKGTYAAGQTGDSSYFNVLNAFFPGYSNFNNVFWGFTYYYANTLNPNGTPDLNHIWNNNSAGNTGDIIVQDA